MLIKQQTEYPWQGDVKINLRPARACEFDLHIRIPGWCQGETSSEALYQLAKLPTQGAAHIRVNGKAVDNVEVVRGYVTLHRRWKSGDLVELNLAMPVQRVKANEHVEADKARVALTRGPIVYCFEGTDNGAAVQNLVISPETQFAPEYRSDLLGGVTVLNGTATAVFHSATGKEIAPPFKVTALPFFVNANRGTSPMQVWMPETQDGARAEKQE